MHTNTGGDAYETPLCGCIKGAIKAKSECERFLLMLTLLLREHTKGAPASCDWVGYQVPILN